MKINKLHFVDLCQLYMLHIYIYINYKYMLQVLLKFFRWCKNK